MKRISKRTTEAMTWTERYTAFCSHGDNMITNRPPRPSGLSLMRQAELWNNWKSAICNWMDQLPAR